MAPAAFGLAAPRPNPFSGATDIRYTLDRPAAARIAIYDVSGRRVTGFQGIGSAGANAVHWDGRDDAGRLAASGTFFYRLESGAYSETRKMTLVK